MGLFTRKDDRPVAADAATALRDRVQQWLSEEFDGVHLRDNGWVMIPAVGSTAVAVDVEPVFDGEHLKVSVFAPLLLDVPLSDELVRYLGLEGYQFHFGTMRLEIDPDSGKGFLAFQYNLLGDALDRVELIHACVMVGGTANEMDNGLQSRFGGRLYCD